MMMIHDPSAIVWGNSTDMRKTADVLDEIAAAAAEIYMARCGKPLNQVLAMMREETWMRGEVARSLGFADEVETDGATMSAPPFKYSLFKNAPAALLPQMQTRAVAVPGNSPAIPAALKEEPVMANPNPAVTPAVIEDDVNLSAKDATKDIFARCRSARLSMEDTEKVIMAANGDSTKARDLIIDMIAERDPAPNMSTHSPATVKADASERFVEGATRALSLKAGVSGGEANEFSGMTMRELARASLEVRGIKPTMADPLQMVQLAFSARMEGGTFTTSDFTNILANVANKSMLKGWSEIDENFDQWTSKGILTDFKPASRVDTGLFPALAQVVEGASYEYGTMSDRGETIQLAKYGKLFAISREAVINDDLNAFTKIPQKMGRAAKRTIGDLVYAILTSNPNMSDGVALFHATHNNLMTGAALSVASLSVAKTAMRKQKDPDSATKTGLNIRPAYLLVPVELEDTARVLMNSEFDPAATQRVPNPNANLATVISDARLSAASASNWYMAANQNLIDTIEVAYLNGVDTPYLEQRNGFEVDGVEFKVRIDAGVKALDFRGLLKNPN